MMIAQFKKYPSRNFKTKVIESFHTVETVKKDRLFVVDDDFIKIVPCSVVFKYEKFVFNNMTICFGKGPEDEEEPEGHKILLVHPNHVIKVANFPKEYRELVFVSLTDEFINNLRLLLTEYDIKPSNLKIMYIDRDDYIDLAVRQMVNSRSLSENLKREIHRSNLEAFCLYLIDKLPSFVSNFIFGTSIGTNSYFVQLMHYSIPENLSLIELAKRANMSLSKFKKVFYENFGETPMQWFRNKKLEEIANLLKTEEFSIQELSDLSGYKNPSNFIKAFKKKYQVTPVQFRKDHSGKEIRE